MQAYPQGSVRQFYLPTDKTKDPILAPPLFVQNVSVPGQTLSDSMTLRPVPPIVHKTMKQTVYNLLLGFPQQQKKHLSYGRTRCAKMLCDKVTVGRSVPDGTCKSISANRSFWDLPGRARSNMPPD